MVERINHRVIPNEAYTDQDTTCKHLGTKRQLTEPARIHHDQPAGGTCHRLPSDVSVGYAGPVSIGDGDGNLSERAEVGDQERKAEGPLEK